jgi:hypothetical protein
MDERRRLERELAEAEAEFDAATELSDIKDTAGRAHRARTALREFDAEQRKSSSGRGGRPPASYWQETSISAITSGGRPSIGPSRPIATP